MTELLTAAFFIFLLLFLYLVVEGCIDAIKDAITDDDDDA